MPLHAEVEAPRWVLQTLDQTVAADRAHLQRVGHAGDRLVVHRVHQQRMRRRRDALPARFERCGPSRLAAWYHALARAVAQHPVQHAARRDVDALAHDVVGRLLLMRRVGEPAGVHVLVQRAAQRHVEHLHAAADAQRGQIALVGKARQLQLQSIAPIEYVHGFSQARFVAVRRRVEIPAAGQHQAVQALYQFSRRSTVRIRAALHGRQQHGHGAGGGHSSHVFHRHALDGDDLVLLLLFNVRGGDADDHVARPPVVVFLPAAYEKASRRESTREESTKVKAKDKGRG